MSLHRQIAQMMQPAAGEPPVVADPVFWVNTYDPDTFEMLGVKTGVGGLTEARSYQIEVPDDQGVYVTVPGGQPAWAGARWDGGVAYADNGSGVLLDPVPTLVHAPQATNLFLYGRDFNDYQEGTMIVSDDVGIDGTIQKIRGTDNSSSIVYKLLDTKNLPVGERVTLCFWVKKEPVGTAYPAVHFAPRAYDLNYACIITLNQETGEYILRENQPRASVAVVDEGDFWRFVMSVSETSYVDYRLTIYAARYETWTSESGDAVATATGQITVDAVSVYTGLGIDQVKHLPPIYTDGVAVTRDSCALSYDSANHDDTVGTYLIEVEHGADGQMLLSEFLRIIGASMRLTDGVNLADVASAAGPHKVGITYGGGSMQLTVDGVKSGAQSYDGGLLVGALDLFRGSPDVGYTGEIKRYDVSDESIVDAWMAE